MNIPKLYHFRCTTPSCGNKLQFPKDIANDVRCARCRKNISLKESIKSVIKCEELYRKAANFMKVSQLNFFEQIGHFIFFWYFQEENTQGAIELFKEGIDLFHEVAYLPHKDTLIAQDSLRTCYSDTGTTFKL